MPETTETDSAPKAAGSEGKPEGEMYANIVSQVVAKIRNEPFLFVIAVVSLLIGLTMLSAKLGSPDLRFVVVVIALLAFAVILGYYTLAGLQTRRPRELPRQGTPNGALPASPGGDGNTGSVNPRPVGVAVTPNSGTASPVQPSGPSTFSGKGRLYMLLAELYGNPSSSRRVVESVGLNPAFVEFKDDALANWNNILSEAKRRGRVNSIVEFACEEYPERANELKASV